MEQIIKTYIGLFFIMATVAIGMNFVYASIVARNANNLVNDYATKIRASNLSSKVISSCQEEVANSGGDYKKLNVDVISREDNKASAILSLEYDYRLPIFGIETEKKVERVV